MSQNKLKVLMKCVHVTNTIHEVTNRAYPSLDKIAKVRWLICEMNTSFKSIWNVVKYLTIDEMMVTYKGKFCTIHQYLPDKPCKWGLKVWCVG